MEFENKPFFRFSAEKVAIRELEEGEYVEEKEQKPNYIITPENRKIFRINVIATLVHKEVHGSITSILIDDGTGKIIVRIFEEMKSIFNLEVGDVIQIIGKVRIYNNEKYVFPEIIKKTNHAWLKIRFLELQKANLFVKKEKEDAENSQKLKKEGLELNELNKKEKMEESASHNFSQKNITPGVEIFEVVNEEIEENDPLLPFEKISKLITQLDKGEGVMIEEIIEKSPLEKTEELIEKMLENGDILQNSPGRVRLL